MGYPNNNCGCDDENDLETPELCGTTCEQINNTVCVIYNGAGFTCGATPLLTTGEDLTTILDRLADQICNGVAGISATVAVNSPATVNEVANGQPAVCSVVNVGTVNDAIFEFTFDIPAGPAGNTAIIVESSTSSVTIADVGSAQFNYTANPDLGWILGQRLRAFHNASNYMEGIITFVTSTQVIIALDYKVGSGVYNSWTLGLAGDVGAQGDAATVAAGTVTATSVAYTGAPSGTVTNVGTPQAAIFDFDFDIPRGIGVSTASINGSGELVIVLEDTTNINVGSVVGEGVPVGGTTGQILAKQSGANYDTEWIDDPSAAHLPTGGTTGQSLRKVSNTDYDADWSTDPLGPVAPSQAVGPVVPIVYATTEDELKDAISQFNATEAGYNGAIIKLAADITLTADVNEAFDGIEIHGDGVWKINHRDSGGGGSQFKFIISQGSPVFKDVVFYSDLAPFAEDLGGTHVQVVRLDNSGSIPSVVKFERCKFHNVVMGPAASGNTLELADAPIQSEVIINNCSIISDLEPDGTTPTVDIKLVIDGSALYEGAVTISDMKWLRATNKGEGVAPAAGPIVAGTEISSIYFKFLGAWGATTAMLNIDMESYAHSELNDKFGVSDVGAVYIKNSVFMYGDNDNAQVSLKPNGFGVFGYNNPSGPHPVDQTTYA